MEVVLVAAAPFRRLYLWLTNFFMHHYFFQSTKSLHESFTFIGAGGAEDKVERDNQKTGERSLSDRGTLGRHNRWV